MSLTAVGWATRQKVGSAALKLVFLYMCERIDDETGYAWPSVAWLSDRTEQDERTVRKALAQLQSTGELKDSGRRVGRQKNVVVWRVPRFDVYLAEKRPNPDKNAGVQDFGHPDDSQAAEVDREKQGENTGNPQPPQICQGSGSEGPVPREPTPTNLSSNPDKFAPRTLPKMSGDSSSETHLKDSKSAQTARAIPAGSRGGAQQTGTQAFDAAASLVYWYNLTLNHVLGSASALGISRYGVQRVDELPHTMRAEMSALVKSLSDWALDEHAKKWADPDARVRRAEHDRIEAEITGRINRELKPYMPAPLSRKSAVAA